MSGLGRLDEHIAGRDPIIWDAVKVLLVFLCSQSSQASEIFQHAESQITPSNTNKHWHMRLHVPNTHANCCSVVTKLSTVYYVIMSSHI